MPTVFIPNKGSHDYSDALRYGKIHFVSTGQLNRYSVGYHARMWHKALENSTKQDMILQTSLTTLFGIGCAIFATKHGRLNLLLFKNDRYIKRTIILDDSLYLEPEGEVKNVAD